MADDNTENLTLRMRVLGAIKAARDLRRGRKEVKGLGDEADRADKHLGRTHKSWKLFTGSARGDSGLISKVSGFIKGFGKAAETASDQGEKLAKTVGGEGGGGSTIRGSLGPLSGISGVTVIAMYALAAVMGGALLTAAVALAASLTVAVGALIALGAAAASFLALGLIVGLGGAALAAARFKQQMNQSGTAAYTLNRAAGRTFDIINRAFGPGIDRVFIGLASFLQKLRPLFQALQQPVLVLGGAMEWFFRTMGDVLNQPVVIAGLQQFITGLAGLAGPVAQIAAVLLPFFIQLANAALPVVVNLLNQAAIWLQKWLGNGQGMMLFQQFLAYAIPHLSAWWQLIKALAPLFLGLLRVAAPFGLMLVRWLTVIVQKMAAWMNTKEGQAQMKSFFANVVPLAMAIVRFLGRLTLLFLQLLPIIAPPLTFLLNAFSEGIHLVSKIVGWLKKPLEIILSIGKYVAIFMYAPFLAVYLLVKKIVDLVSKIKPGEIGKKIGGGLGFDPTPGFDIPGIATGGPVSSGRTYLVGEEGPELFRPHSSGQITANDRAFAPSPGGFYADVTLVMPDGSVMARESVRAARRDKALR